ncbi:peptidoglycan DD-metalloendopeptidase family protein [Deinococcus sp. SDU3-2]|uniref:Peptidoglycan DD-metalloendopeptidase family protein n=2 Tax=Deinococcaceae TaxID=183710 RepID=A0A7X1NYS2_9DEIO|nr:peptidoglycan DD-metalloendopeptidase family protein [Deinococcus terrestris]
MRFLATMLLTLAGGVSAATIPVLRGDTLTRLAVRHGTTVSALVQANPGVRPNALRIGQRLTLPASSPGQGKTATLRTASLRVTPILPVQGRVTTSFGTAHPGLDLAAPAGTPIRATLSGTVTESRFDARSGWGWTIVINHGGGLKSRYSHNSLNLARVGHWVNAGQVIARVGSTGKSTGAHVDFRVYRSGVAVSPFAFQ